ncbi:MAG: caspase family protein [Myxococcota bacterium]
MRRWAIGLLFAGVGALPAEAATHLIAVGNNSGQGDEPRLRYAERDAQELTNVLRRLGRVSAENTRLLLGEDAETFRRVLLNANVRLRSSPGSVEGDALIIYYSGHADAAGLHLGGSVLPYDELKALVEGSPAQVRLLIIDSCQSGGITQIKGAKPAPPFAIKIEHRLDAEGLAIITSSAGTEDSQESESLQASFFTHHFVNALRGAADLDHDGRVTLNEAYGYAYRGTLHSSGRTTRLQHPTYSYELKGKGDFVLTFTEAASPNYGRLHLSTPGSYLVLDRGDEGSVVAELLVDDDGSRLLLSPGKYFVRKRSDTSYREYQIDLVQGKEVELDQQPFEEITYARLLRKGGGVRDSFHTFSLVLGVGGATAPGFGIMKNLSLGYALDFPWITAGLELRLGLSSADNTTVSSLERDLAVRIRAERYVDFDFASFSLGLFVEGENIYQSYDSAGDAPSRNAWGLGFGGLAAIERTLTDQLALRLEGGLITHVVPTATLDSGAAVSSNLTTPVSGWVGLGGRFSL